MDGAARARWAWTARKWAVSAFLVVHLAATCIWVLPECPLRVASSPALSYYVLPLGLWDYWGMFAPDPVRDTVTLEADVVDARGLRYAFAFPKLADYSRLAGVPRFRHSKFAANLGIGEAKLCRELTTHHVVRQLSLPKEAFPVDVRLIYQVRNTPPPGGPPADPMTPTYPYVLDTYHIASHDEVTR